MGCCASSCCFSWAVDLLEERVNQRFHDSSAIIAKEIFWVNLQYLRSNGFSNQIRGNGALVLTANLLWFTYVFPERQIEMHIQNIRTVKVGRARGLSRALIIDFVDTTTGKDDQVVFAIRHPKRWKKWINETVQTSENSMPPSYWSVFNPLQMWICNISLDCSTVRQYNWLVIIDRSCARGAKLLEQRRFLLCAADLTTSNASHLNYQKS